MRINVARLCVVRPRRGPVLGAEVAEGSILYVVDGPAVRPFLAADDALSQGGDVGYDQQVVSLYATPNGAGPACVLCCIGQGERQ